MLTAPGARVEIGVVARAHGIRGEILIAPHDPMSRTLADLGELALGDRTFAIARARPTNNGWIVALEGVASRNDAELLRGARVTVPRDALDLADDEFLLDDLVGCRVVGADGAAWGLVAGIETGAQTRLIIHHADRERLVPLVDALVASIDLEARVVTVAIEGDWPDAPIER
jgi:16S rRNA processing protein RimM